MKYNNLKLHQVAPYNSVIGGEDVFCRYGRSSGKTHMVNAILDSLKNTDKEIFVFMPFDGYGYVRAPNIQIKRTGVPKPINYSDFYNRLSLKGTDPDLVIIEEADLMHDDMLEHLFRFASIVCGAPVLMICGGQPITSPQRYYQGLWAQPPCATLFYFKDGELIREESV